MLDRVLDMLHIVLISHTRRPVYEYAVTHFGTASNAAGARFKMTVPYHNFAKPFGTTTYRTQPCLSGV